MKQKDSKQKENGIKLVLALSLILLTPLALAETNVSILHGWNGTANVPVQVTTDGAIKTTLNLTQSVGLNPGLNNTYDIGASNLLWANLYSRNIRSTGILSLYSDDTERITLTEAGLVGIGHNKPNSTLHIQGTLNLTGNATLRDYASCTALETNAQGLLQCGTDNTGTQNTSIGGGWTNTTTQVSLNNANNNITAGTLHIDNTNNKIGINVTIPQALLHVNGSSPIAIWDTDSTGGFMTFKQGGTDSGFLGPGNGGVIFTDSTTNSLNIRSENSLHLGANGDNLIMTINNNKIGIGTTTPNELLTIAGNTAINGTITTRTDNNLIVSDGYICLDNNGAATGTCAGTTDGIVYADDFVCNGGNCLGAADIDESSLTGTATSLTVGDLSCTDCIGTTEITDSYLLNTGDTATGNYTYDTNTLHIDSTNNKIGIGTTNPNTTLHVDGGINVTTGNDICIDGGDCLSTATTNVTLNHVYNGTTWIGTKATSDGIMKLDITSLTAESSQSDFTVNGNLNVTGTATGNFGPMKSYTSTLADVENTASETTQLSFTIPANDWADGDVIYAFLHNKFKNNKGTSGTATTKVNVGSGAQVTINNAQSYSNSATEYDAAGLVCVLLRSGSDVIVLDPTRHTTGQPTGPYWPAGGSIAGTSTPTNFTSDITIEVKVTLSAADPTFYFRAQNARIWKVGT